MNNKPDNFDEEFEQIVDEIMEERATGAPNAFMSEEQMRAKVCEEVKEMLKFQKETEAVTNSIALLVDLGPKMYGQSRMNDIFNEIRNAGEVLIESSEEISKTPEKTAEMIGMTDDTLNDILKIALDEYEQERWESAESLYLFLTILTPINPELWMCLGSCQQNQGKINEARESYMHASELDNAEPHYPLYVAECCLLEGDLETSKDWEESGRLLLEDRENDKEIIEMFDAVKEAIAAAA